MRLGKGRRGETLYHFLGWAGFSCVAVAVIMAMRRGRSLVWEASCIIICCVMAGTPGLGFMKNEGYNGN